MLVSAKIIAYFAKTRSLSFLMCCFTNDTFSLPSPHSDQPHQDGYMADDLMLVILKQRVYDFAHPLLYVVKLFLVPVNCYCYFP